MKKGSLFTILMALCSIPAISQVNDSAPTKINNNIFVEIGGNGVIMSLNYDTRFSKSNHGLGGRIGVGMAFVPNHMLFDIVPTIPFAINYLTGSGPNHLEAGAGVTYGVEKFGGLTYEDRNQIYFVPSLGYRYQPLEGGLSFRAVVSPFISNRVGFSAGLSIGGTF